MLALCPKLRAIIHADGKIKHLLDRDFFDRNLPLVKDGAVDLSKLLIMA